MSENFKFGEKNLEKAVKESNTVDGDHLLFSFNFVKIEQLLIEEETNGFEDFYKDPSICFTPLIMNFMKAALSADKLLAQDTINLTVKAIETIKSRKCCEDIKGNIITVEDFLSKNWKIQDLESINACSIELEEEGSIGNFSARALVILSELYALIALLQLTSGSYLKGAYNLRKAWKSYANLSNLNDFIINNDNNQLTLLDDHSYMSHFLLGFGAFHFFVSLIPKSFQWIIKILGFKGDRDEGIRELYQCLDIGVRRDTFAGLILLWIESFFYEDNTKGEQLFTRLITKYPEASLYYYLGGYLSRDQGNVDQALERFNISYQLNEQFYVMENIGKYEIGWGYYLK